MHTFGPLAPNVGLDRQSRQLYGVSNLGVTPVQAALGTTIFLSSIVVYVASGLVQSAYDGYFLGRERKKGITYKTIAKRNALLGGVMGAAAVAYYGYKNELTL